MRGSVLGNKTESVSPERLKYYIHDRQSRRSAHRSQERHPHGVISQPAQFKVTTPTKTIKGRVPPRLPVSQHTAVLRSSLNATGSHRPSHCANSGTHCDLCQSASLRCLSRQHAGSQQPGRHAIGKQSRIHY